MAAKVAANPSSLVGLHDLCGEHYAVDATDDGSGELGSEAGRIMITLTLVEDLAVVILTIVLPSLPHRPLRGPTWSDTMTQSAFAAAPRPVVQGFGAKE